MEDIFDEVWVINLKRRPDRLARFFDNIQAVKWPFKYPEIFYAIDGNKVGVPRYWQTGGGSYGCHRSHLLLLERAIQEDLKSILILEDDAMFMQDFSEKVQKFFTAIPEDWECLMLGGQHANSTPIPITRGVVRAGAGPGIQRTHCYGIQGHSVMKVLYKAWAESAVHCDWVMGECLAKRKTFAPDPFLVGQALGASDISGTLNPPKFWSAPTGRESVILLKATREVMEELQQKGWHGGFNRDRATGIDVGLIDIFARTTKAQERASKLRQWIETIQWEVVSMEDAIACIWHPEITLDMVQGLIRGSIIEIDVNSTEEALSSLPSFLKGLEIRKIPIVILRAPQSLMEQLRIHGFHCGHLREEITSEDLSVRQAILESRNADELSCKVVQIAKSLDQETISIPNGIVTFWHPKIQKNLFPEEEFHVLELFASTVEDATVQRNRWVAELPFHKEIQREICS